MIMITVGVDYPRLGKSLLALGKRLVPGLGKSDEHKRAKTLRRFLARERIYQTEIFFHGMEVQARANLRAPARGPPPETPRGRFGRDAGST
mgnify:CR=1 FL=1